MSKILLVLLGVVLVAAIGGAGYLAMVSPDLPRTHVETVLPGDRFAN